MIYYYFFFFKETWCDVEILLHCCFLEVWRQYCSSFWDVCDTSWQCATYLQGSHRQHILITFCLGSAHLWVPMGTSLAWMHLLCVDYPLPEWHVKKMMRIVCLPTVTRRQSKKLSSFRLPPSLFQCNSTSILWFGKVDKWLWQTSNPFPLQWGTACV